MTNQQGAPEAPSYEHQRAIMEGERNASLDAYSRVVYLTQTESRIYEAAFTNGWNRLAAMVEAQQPAPSAAAEVENLRKALQFYADKEHFNIADDGAWDTVSGEPQNYWCDEEGTATVEDGTIARLALAGHRIKFDTDEAPQPSPTPQADSQPAPVLDERDAFEKVFPLPSGCIRCGTGYASTGYSNWAAHTHVERWQGWQARAARAPADSVTAPVRQGKWTWVPVEPSTAMLVAGNHGQPGDFSALKVWEDMLGALDRSFDYTRPVDPPSTQPAQAADSVLEDAARWFSERDNVLHSFLVLLGEAEAQADNDNDPLLRHQVEGFYRQWNALNGSALEPRWVTRAARKHGGAT